MSAEKTPDVPQKAPYGVQLEPGTYWWCACGKSANQPFCDGAHKGSGFAPQKLEVEEAKTYWLCGCKHSANTPFCDGGHKKI